MRREASPCSAVKKQLIPLTLFSARLGVCRALCATCGGVCGCRNGVIVRTLLFVLRLCQQAGRSCMKQQRPINAAVCLTEKRRSRGERETVSGGVCSKYVQSDPFIRRQGGLLQSHSRAERPTHWGLLEEQKEYENIITIIIIIKIHAHWFSFYCFLKYGKVTTIASNLQLFKHTEWKTNRQLQRLLVSQCYSKKRNPWK